MTAPTGLTTSDWTRVAAVVSATLGLHFPPKRMAELQRGIRGACAELGFPDEVAGVHALLARPASAATVHVLASHLTIGETYFFRDKASLDALSHHVLPALIYARRNGSRKLRVWCAGCCTGEEAYTLAILLHQLLPDIALWDVTVVATDINPHFLRKAAAGSYGAWSFRNAPEWLLRRYFKPDATGRQTVVPEIRRMVTFAQLNLADPVYQATGVDLHHMDVVMCRNVLMYFTPQQMEAAIERLNGCLTEDGWLVVGPGEVPATGRALRSSLQPVVVEGAVLLHKQTQGQHGARRPGDEPGFVTSSGWDHDNLAPVPASAPSMAPSMAAAAAARGVPSQALRAQYDADARSLANRGKLREALQVCDEWLHQDRLNPVAHYLRAEVLMEQGDDAVHRLAAQDALRRALYLDADFVLAHVALGRLALRGAANESAAKEGAEQAVKHMARAQVLLRQLPSGDAVPGGDGLPAAQVLAQVTQTLRALRAAQPGRAGADDKEAAA